MSPSGTLANEADMDVIAEKESTQAEPGRQQVFLPAAVVTSDQDATEGAKVLEESGPPGPSKKQIELPKANRAESIEQEISEEIDAFPNIENSSHEAVDQEATTKEEVKPAAPPRILHVKHFDIALREITPSSSEHGNLPELRKVSRAELLHFSAGMIWLTTRRLSQWAEQYGEGGSKRGKRGGYGAKFGFGQLGLEGKEDPAFGRVRPEGE